jgi:hypothetical protein
MYQEIVQIVVREINENTNPTTRVTWATVTDEETKFSL